MKIYIGFHESVGDTDSKEANLHDLSWMPYKDLKILNKKITLKFLFGVMVAQVTYTILFMKEKSV